MSPKKTVKWLVTIKVLGELNGWEYSEALINNDLINRRICYSTKGNLLVRGIVFYNCNINVYNHDVTNLIREISGLKYEVIITHREIE